MYKANHKDVTLQMISTQMLDIVPIIRLEFFRTKFTSEGEKCFRYVTDIATFQHASCNV